MHHITITVDDINKKIKLYDNITMHIIGRSYMQTDILCITICLTEDILSYTSNKSVKNLKAK